MTPLVRAGLAVAACLAVLAPAPAVAAPAAAATCTKVTSSYPKGLASSARAARAYAAATGVRVPVNRAAFQRFAALDRDRDGVLCARRTGAPGSSPAATSTATTKVPALPAGDSAHLRSPSECMLRTADARTVSLGFNRPAGRTPTEGTPKATVLMVDFPNAPAQESVADRYNLIVPGALGLLGSASYGRLSITASPHLTWVRMPKSSSEYGFVRGLTFADHKAYLQDAIAAADARVDFSDSDLVIVMTSANAPDMGFSPTFAPYPGDGVVADGRTITNAVTLGTDFEGRQDRVLAHELLHTLGLVDLYSFADPAHQFAFTGPYSLMGDVTTTMPGPTAWERWVLAWLDDRQIACVGSGDSLVTLEPVSRSGTGVKAVVVPRGNGTAVVVEARSAEGIDAAGPSGVIVYTVSPGTASGYGPIVMPGEGASVLSPLQAGQSITVSGVTVTVVSGGANPQVRVSVA